MMSTTELGLPDATQDDILKAIWSEGLEVSLSSPPPDEFRASIAETLGHTHPGMEGPCVMSDRDILKAIRELRANVAEGARQLKEAQDKYSEQLEEARVEYVRSRADCDARCERLTASWLTESHECRRLQQQLDRLRR